MFTYIRKLFLKSFIVFIFLIYTICWFIKPMEIVNAIFIFCYLMLINIESKTILTFNYYSSM